MAATILAQASIRSAERSRLLQLPAELKNMIYRLVIVESGTMTIDSNINGFQAPPLLMACKELRKEAATIFYAENKFEIIVDNYNIAPFIRWQEIVSAAVRRGEAKSTDDVESILSGVCTPNWSNLLKWLKGVHESSVTKRIATPSEISSAAALDQAVVGGMFGTCEKMRCRSWEEVEALMKEWRAVLVRIDARWDQ